MIKTVYIVAAERSGDELGARLISQLRILNPALRYRGIGGSSMAGQNVHSLFDISPLSIMGFVEGIRAYPAIMKLVEQTVADILQQAPDMVVLIDSWGFMMRVAERLKKRGFEGVIVKYVAPQVWAMRERRTKVLAKSVDHLLTIHSFDAPYFEREGLEVTYVGNPVFDTDYLSGDARAFRKRVGISDTAPLLAILFGSRASEINRLAKPFADAVEILKREMPELTIVAPLAESIATQVLAMAGADPRLQDVILLPESDKLDIFTAATASIACSGTVTTQLASAGVPTVIGYKLSPLTWALAKHLYKPDHVSIVNIAAAERLMPEHIQKQCTGRNLAASVMPYLIDTQKRAQDSSALLEITSAMRGPRAQSSSSRAAKAVLKLLA